MTENATTNATTEKTVRSRSVEEDLSKEIEQSLDRQPDERVKVIRLFGDCYRCNWWVQDKTPHPFWLASGTIRRSSFLRVTRATMGLLKQDATEGK